MEQVNDKQKYILQRFKGIPIRINTHIGKSEIIPFDNVISFNLTQDSTNYESNELNFCLDEMNNTLLDNEIIICNFIQLNNLTIYIFLTNEKIFIINSIYFPQLKLFLDKIIDKNKLFFISSKCQEHFQKDFPNQAKFKVQSKQSIQNFNIEINNFYKHYSKSYWNSFDLLFLKPIFGYVLQKAYNKSSHQRGNLLNSKLNDFISLRDICQNVHLRYNKIDQKIYILKLFCQSSQMFCYEKTSYELLGNEFPYINNYYGAIEGSPSCIITDFIEGQTLNNIKEMKLTFEEKIKIIIELALSIEYCHSKGLIIRDLRPVNIFINSNRDAILFDFDNSRTECENEEDEKTCFIRDDHFLAPEQSEAKYSYKVDIYSFGAIICYIVNENDSFKLPEDFYFLQKIVDESFVSSPDERSNISRINNLLLHSIYNSINYGGLQNRERFIDRYLKNMLEIRIKYLQQEKDSFLTKSEILLYFGWIYYNCKYFEKNYQLSINYFNQSAELKNSEALCFLGQFYYFIKKDEQKGIDYYKLSADLQNSSSQCFLAQIYINKSQNMNKAIEYLQNASKKNHTHSNYLLGLIYYDGKYLPSDEKKIVHYFTLAANNRHKDACLWLANLYFKGKFVKKDINLAIKYYMLAADQNCSESQLKLGIIYYCGTGVQKDEEKGLYYLNLSASQNNEKAISFMKIIEEINFFSSSIKRKKLDSNYSFLDNPKNIQFVINHAKKGDTTAQYVLGRYYLSKDINKSIDFLTRSAKQQPAAAHDLGIIYLRGTHVKQDINKSIYYLTKSADLGNDKAQNYLGRFYYEGIYVKKDVKKGINYFILSANQNNSLSLYDLGIIYLCGVEVPVDINKAIKYFQLAAQQNNTKAYLELALIYSKSAYIKHDIPKAIHYLKMLPNDDPEAQLILGEIYLDTESGFYDIEKAIRCIEFAANQNNREAQYILGKLYTEGKLPKYSIDKAIYYLKRASSHGFIPAKTLLGQIYSDNKFVSSNPKLSVDNYRMAANYNDANAQYQLGIIYLKGEIVPRDMEKALYYLEMASKNGIVKCRFLIGYLYHTNEFIPRNIEKAIHFYIEASNTDYRAATNLGVIYKKGEGVEKNIPKAIYFFEKAIRNGNCMLAMFNLGRIYYYENNYADIGKATDLLQKASDCGLPTAKILLDLIFYSSDDQYKGWIPDECISYNLDNLESFDLIYYFNDIKRSPDPKFKKVKQFIKKDINENFYEGFWMNG